MVHTSYRTYRSYRCQKLRFRHEKGVPNMTLLIGSEVTFFRFDLTRFPRRLRSFFGFRRTLCAIRKKTNAPTPDLWLVRSFRSFHVVDQPLRGRGLGGEECQASLTRIVAKASYLYPLPQASMYCENLLNALLPYRRMREGVASGQARSELECCLTESRLDMKV